VLTVSGSPGWIRPAGAQDLERFRAGYRSASGYSVDPRFLKRARVFVLRDRQGDVVGGYLVNTRPPLRTFARLPEAASKQLVAPLPLARVIEVACVWLAPEVRGPIASIVLWTHLAWHVGRHHGYSVIFGTEVPSLARFYESFGALQMYAGTVTVDGVTRPGWIYTIRASSWPVLVTMAVRRNLRRRSP
jgi:hypothetical protein